MAENPERKDVQINGNDYTDYFTRTGYQVQYVKVSGQNEGLMLSGSFTEDVLAIKAVVTLPLMPLSEDQQSKILSDVMSSDYASVYYFDPRKNAYRTAVMRYEVSQAKYRGIGADGKSYWTGSAVTFEDRFSME